MYQYSLTQWLFFFFFYCFVGWCFESTYVSVRTKKWVNRGFCRGPFLPLYGSGALMMLFVSIPVRESAALTYLAGFIGATVLEYFTGVAMEALFKVRYWDYSSQKFNFQGHICLSSSLFWGVLTVLLTRVIHKPVEGLALSIPSVWLKAIVAVVAVCFVADFTVSFQAAMDLREVLIRAEQAKQDLERMKKRLDVLVAVANDEIDDRVERTELRIARKREELVEELEERFERIRKRLPESEALLEVREELQELRDKFVVNKNLSREKLENYIQSIVKRDMLKGNPTMTSRRFREALDELKQAAENYKNKKD